VAIKVIMVKIGLEGLLFAGPSHVSRWLQTLRHTYVCYCWRRLRSSRQLIKMLILREAAYKHRD